jgi:hypothetical protein
MRGCIDGDKPRAVLIRPIPHLEQIRIAAGRDEENRSGESVLSAPNKSLTNMSAPIVGGVARAICTSLERMA